MKRAKQQVFYDDREARRLRKQVRDRISVCYPPFYPNGQLWTPELEINERINGR